MLSLLSRSTGNKYPIGLGLVPTQSRRTVVVRSVSKSATTTCGGGRSSLQNGCLTRTGDYHCHHNQDQQYRVFSSQQRRRQERQQERRHKLKISVLPKLTSLTSQQELQQQQQQQQQQEQEEKDRNKPRKPWWRYITIWPDPHGYDPEFERQHGPRWPKTKAEWDIVLAQSKKDYRSTFEGWLLPESKETEAEKADTVPLADLVETQRKEISSNVAKNVKFLKEEGSETLKTIQKKTGIYTMQHLREWAARQLQLATECVNEFMVGYRQGRDDEIDKMMNLYFQQLVEEDDNDQAAEHAKKKRRRKPKQRVRTTQ